MQRFCSHSCWRALERVRERERRWKEAHDLILHIDPRPRTPYIQTLFDLMRLEFHQLDRRREHLWVYNPARHRRLLTSQVESGQQTPIVVVAA